MRIAIGGDFSMNDALGALGRRWLDGDPVPALDHLRARFEDADLALVNLETSLVPDGSGDPPLPDKILLRAADEAIPVARRLGIRAVTVANNHAFDFGPATLERLSAVGIAYVGGGRDREEAARPLLLEAAGSTVALLGWADRGTIHGVWADAKGFGALACGPDELVECVRQTRPRVDRLLVLPHWGVDYVKYPSPRMRAIGRALLDAGADAVVGTHSHVIGCMELHRGRPIVYSTGSLLLDDPRDAQGALTGPPCPPFDSVVVGLDLSGAAPALDFAGFRCFKGELRRLPGDRARRRLERNSRFLHGAGYERRYAAYESRMRPWGIRARGAWSRPGDTLYRLARLALRRLASPRSAERSPS